MTCEWGHDDCINLDVKCNICLRDSAYYIPPKVKKVGLNKTPKVKKTARQGSVNEVKTYNQLKNSIDSVQGTPNSGAGSIKGDLQIDSMAMVECKTTTKKNEGRQPGKESFSIQRAHLEKLKKEAKEARKEFHFLVFSFKEHDNDLYVVSDLENYNSMIATMKQDRAKAKDVDARIDIYRKRFRLLEADNVKLKAEIEYLESKLKYYEMQEKGKE